MNKLVRLDQTGIEIIGGQIVKRITADTERGDEVVDIKKVLIPKAISSEGFLIKEYFAEEKLKTEADTRRLTAKGDIVIKLSTPYDAAFVEKDEEGLLVPSFCAIIKAGEEIPAWYMLAFLNSSYCKSQIKTIVAGVSMAMLSVGKLKELCIPLLDDKEMAEIGERYRKTSEKIQIVNRIVELEKKRNDVVFRNLVKKYE